MSALLLAQSLQWLLALCSVLLLVPALVFGAQAWLGSTRKTSQTQAARRPMAGTQGLVVLVPAHNEAFGIAKTLEAVRAQLHAHDRIVVVADNCTDDTAALAQGPNTTVLVRHDTERRGKGYALDHGIAHLRASPPDLVIMLDADCTLHPGSLDALADACRAHRAPIQARYLMSAPKGAPLKTRVAAFAWLVKNHVRPLGASRLGWPCLLTGSGMAFPWAVIEQAPLASGHLVEDMQLGIDLSLQGHCPHFCEQALVTSEFPTSDQGLQTQRRRWEHGHLSVIQSQVPRLVRASVQQGRTALLGLALDLGVPPLASLVALLTLICLASGLLSIWTGHWWLSAPSVLGWVTVAATVTWAWRRMGQGILSSADLLGIPMYVLAKAPVYAAFLTGRETSWVRTRRQDGQD